MGAQPRFGFRVVGTIKGVKGHCNAGPKVGQQMELSGHNAGGMCGFFYHAIFPYIIMMPNSAADSRSIGAIPTSSNSNAWIEPMPSKSSSSV